MLKLIPLGGLGEVGLNMMVFEYEKTIFIIDSGLMFPEAHMLGIDYAIPNMDYLRLNRNKIAAIILTHAHEDHIGAIPFFLKEFRVPVFATEFTLEIVRHKLEEHSVTQDILLHKIYPGEKLKIGPFKIEIIQVEHSIINGIALAIQTPIGNIIHTGDFKISHSEKKIPTQITDINAFAKYGNNHLLALLSDSTNIEKSGYNVPSDTINNELKKLAKKSTGRIIIALFASNIERIQRIINIASIENRKIIFNGKSLELTVNIARKLGNINIPQKMEISIDEIKSYPDNKIMLITTGSQGEPLSALTRMASKTHKQIKIKDGDMVILSSKFIPGNGKAIAHTINKLFKLGADVIYEKISRIHISGHAFREELKFMIQLTKPKFFIPIHGEYRHLCLHSKLANKAGIPKERIILTQNGEVIELSRNSFKKTERITSGRILIDGKGVGDVARDLLKERHILSREGFVVVNMAFDEKTGAVIHGPEIISKGFIFKDLKGYLLTEAQCIVLEAVEEYNSNVPARLSKIKSKIQLLLRQYFFYTIGRKPIIIPCLFKIQQF